MQVCVQAASFPTMLQTMILANPPKVLIWCDTHEIEWSDPGVGVPLGYWRLVIRSGDGRALLEVNDVEPGVVGERLALLTVVRGLEALEHSSAVTLVTSSRYVRQGLRYGLAQWKRDNWCWERFGTMVRINHVDLWRRVDRALEYHDVVCRILRFDAVHDSHIENPSEMRHKPSAAVQLAESDEADRYEPSVAATGRTADIPEQALTLTG
jgi:ribonuclease HI